MTSSTDRLAVVLAQPAAWTEDGAANLAAVGEAVRAAGPFGADHVLVLPELVGATMPRSQYVAALRTIGARAERPATRSTTTRSATRTGSSTPTASSRAIATPRSTSRDARSR